MPIRCGEGKFHDSGLTFREVRDSPHLSGVLWLVSGGVEIGYPFASHHDASLCLVISGRGRCTSLRFCRLEVSHGFELLWGEEPLVHPDFCVSLGALIMPGSRNEPGRSGWLGPGREGEELCSFTASSGLDCGPHGCGYSVGSSFEAFFPLLCFF